MRVLALSAILLLATRALAADCSISKPFTVEASQRFDGLLKDPAGQFIPGLGLELLESGRVVRQFRTDNEGKFDLGLLQAGSYKIRIVSQPFCAPKISCGRSSCTVSQVLRLNEKKAKPVTIQ